MRFEFLRKQTIRAREKDPKYRITPSGRIQFNKLAVERVLLPVINDAHLVLIGYDQSNEEIAIAPASPDQLAKDPTIIPFKVVTTAGGRQRSIPAKVFFDRVGLSLPESGIDGNPRIENDPNFGQFLVLSVKGTRVKAD